MSSHLPENSRQLRFEAHEKPPAGLCSLLAAQILVLNIAGIVLTPVIVLRGAGMPASMEASLIFYALMVSGVTTIVQARQVWRFGSGHILLMGTSGAFIAVGITALKSGGMGLLMALIIAAALVQFLFAGHLGLLRRLVTPLVGGTTIMLIAVTIMPIAFSHFPKQAENPVPLAAAGTTLAAIILLSFFGGRLRLWAPLIGVFAGCLVSWLGGGLDLSRVVEAPWIGLPQLQWTGIDLSFSAQFWMLLPAFAIVTVVGAIETYGDAIAIQDLSARDQRPVDFRAVQGALYADGLGNILSGLLGTLPNTTYSSSISVVEMTGVAARRVGIYCGIFMLLIAFLPKLTALLLSVPAPVVGSYIAVLILLLFIHGLRMVADHGLGFENGLIVGMGFWLGMGFQQQVIFPGMIPAWLSPILDNGMVSGTLVTLILVGILNLKNGPRASLKTDLDTQSLPLVNEFILKFCDKKQLTPQMSHRIQLAVEEVLLGIKGIEPGAAPKTRPRQLRLELRKGDSQVEIDLAIASVSENIELLIDAAKQTKKVAVDHLSFKILGSLVTEFRHFQFHGVDYIALKLTMT